MDEKKELASPNASPIQEGASGCSSHAEHLNASSDQVQVAPSPIQPAAGAGLVGPAVRLSSATQAPAAHHVLTGQVEVQSAQTVNFTQPERRSVRKLRFAIRAVAVLGLGWVIGLNTQSVDIAQGKTWLYQSGSSVSSAFVSAGRDLVNRLERVIGPYDKRAETPNIAEALDRAANTLNKNQDQIRVSYEDRAREIDAKIDNLQASVDRGYTEMVSKLAHVAERLEQVERQATVPKVKAQGLQQPTAMTASALPTGQGSASAADPKIMPVPNTSDTRREPTVVKQWRVRQVLDGMAVLEGPRGLIGVARGEVVPGVGRVESIMRRGNQWVVATTKGVITGTREP